MAACASPHPHRIELRVYTAEELRTVDDDFVALYVEAIEHMLDQPTVVRQVAGPLTHGGVFIALTPNGNYWWYTFLALYLGISTGHLTTGSFLTRNNSSVTVCQSAPSITVTGPSFPKAICPVG
jgi:2-polyprenyl-3-methyl-5-hydroxy-6-metoxy-1,4-benzoquinol methylase